MNIAAVPILADALKEYYEHQELQELCSLFDVVFDDTGERPHFHFAKRLVNDIEHGNNRRFLDAIIPHLLTRCDENIAYTDFERQSYHKTMAKRLKVLEGLLGEPQMPREISVTEAQPFRAKSEVREFLAASTTELVVVDNYVGPGTLDCLREVPTSIRLLTEGEMPLSPLDLMLLCLTSRRRDMLLKCVVMPNCMTGTSSATRDAG